MYKLKLELIKLTQKQIILSAIVSVDFKDYIGKELKFANDLQDFIYYNNRYYLEEYDETCEFMFYADTSSWRYAIPVEIFETLKL